MAGVRIAVVGAAYVGLSLYHDVRPFQVGLLTN